MKRSPFIVHCAIAGFIPYLQSYSLKGLEGIEQNEIQPTLTNKELYSARVFERIGELDNIVNALYLAIDFVAEMKNVRGNVPEVYRYHYENFLLRLTGLVDRAYRLVGVSLLLDPCKLNNNGAATFVKKEIGSIYPELIKCLSKLDKVSSKHKPLRNEIAHSNAFSSHELGLFSAIVSLNLEVDDKTKLDKLMNNYFSSGGAELALIVDKMVAGIEELLEALAPIYEQIFAGND